MFNGYIDTSIFPFLAVNYLVDNFSENVGLSKSKYR